MEKSIFTQLMEKELYSGAGCGEAKAFAFAAASARKYAAGEINRIAVEGSALFVIGVQTVVIPNTKGKRGALLSSAMGAIGGKLDLGLGLLDAVKEADIRAAEELVATGKVSVKMDPTVDVPYPAVYLKTTVETDQHTATVILLGGYDNVAYIEQNGKVLLDKRSEQPKNGRETIDWSELSVDNIYDYCKICDISELERFRPLIEETREISKDGLYNSYGMQVGRTLLENIEQKFLTEDENNHILMWTVAGIDARMNGSSCPSVGNTGSGSQGHIICAAPIASGDYRGCGEEEIVRAVAMANLLNIYMNYATKDFSHLSPMCYCGSVASVVAAGAVSFLHGFTKEQITDVLRTGLSILPGIICDGASKPTCALRVYAGLSGALQAMRIVERGLSAKGYEGFMNDNLDVILNNLYLLQRDGMSSIYGVLYKMKNEQGNII